MAGALVASGGFCGFAVAESFSFSFCAWASFLLSSAAGFCAALASSFFAYVMPARPGVAR